MRAVSTWLRRTPAYKAMRQVPRRVRRHLMLELETLRREEEQVARTLSLRRKPRLTLVDEETTTVVTSQERAALETAQRGRFTPSRAQDRREYAARGHGPVHER
ncbi:hypothetical protein CKO28_16530 [Rhodovibrio sodomensis]|uniref:Uncharacterized protein n=1 Tax=Rhodovibrio sodomensis TaxID=1088 RepID=A0ABS1DGP5_9PROT|nr:hypothetical protein [Rhodovibrio sodomensis]MBK1669646.1 hypothetical protein [Rhodovibrio sodomensis]